MEDEAAKEAGLATEAEQADAEACEFSPEEIAAFEAADEQDALAALFDYVRTCSTDGRLSVPSEWEEAGIAPDHMGAEGFEMFVYDYLEERRMQREAEQAPQLEAPAYRTATRAVGVPRPFGASAADVAAEGNRGELEAVLNGEEFGESAIPKGGTGLRAGGQGDAPCGEIGGFAAEEVLDSGIGADEPIAGSGQGDDFTGFDVPDGFELVELEGEMTLVPIELDDDAEEIACDDIVVLMGKRSYYLYSKDVMTDRYAHWAFLACEDDRIVTFAECVRDESRTYPRPMAADSLFNEPFNMTEDEVAETWAAISESGEYPDIQTTTASNGDVYFYSTEYLSPAYAASLAEWHAVERGMYL